MLRENDDIRLIPVNVICPPAAITDREAAVVWDKPELWKNVKEYEIYVDNGIVGTTDKTGYTIRDLAVNVEYTITVRSITADGELSGKSEPILLKTKAAEEVMDITAFGAVGDGVTLNTEAIQRAIDACPYEGRVVIPPGIFVSGAIFLKGNMTLYLSEGAVLLGSSDTKDYPLMEYRFEGMEKLCYASLVNTKTSNVRLSDITIAGPGVINANGEKLFRAEMDEKEGVRGRAVCIRNVDRFYMQDVTVRQSPAWCVHLIYCNDVSINNVSVYTKYDENGVRYKDIFNGDGIDPDSCKNVYIFNSLIASQDDCIAIKSGRDAEGRAVGIPCENIRITDCIFNSGFGVAIGSEMSGGVRNVLVRDCNFNDTFSIGTVKAPRGRGNVIENIMYENITHKNFSTEHKDCRWFRGAIYIDQFYSHETFDADASEPVGEGTSIIRNITFKDIELETAGGNAIYLAGLLESPLINITLDNVKAKGRRGMKAMNIDGLCMNDVTVTSCEDDAYYLKNVKESKR